MRKVFKKLIALVEMEYYGHSKESLIENIKQGKVFIYPTDTVYGLGCDVFNEESVERIKSIKERDREKPLSIIAPSKQWIKDNLIIDNVDIEKYLPGPYTLILKKKNKDFLSHISPTDSLGVRIPDNDFTKLVEKAGVPFVTTSVNLSKEPPASKISEVKEEISSKVDLVVDAGSLNGRPSTIILPDGSELKR